MRAIVNIPLFESVGGPGLQTEQRFSAAVSRLRQFFPRSIGEINEGPITSTAVVVVETANNKDAVLQVIYRISKDFGLDFIPVLFCDGQGRLAGANADLHGPFDKKTFIFPDYFAWSGEA